MGKRISKGVAKLGERGQSGGAIITGANLRRPPEKKAPEPDANSDPLSAATPEQALAMAKDFLAKLKPGPDEG